MSYLFYLHVKKKKSYIQIVTTITSNNGLTLGLLSNLSSECNSKKLPRFFFGLQSIIHGSGWTWVQYTCWNRVTSGSVYLRNHCSESHSVDESGSGTATWAQGTSSETFLNPNRRQWDASYLFTRTFSQVFGVIGHFCKEVMKRSLKIISCCLGLLLFNLDSSKDSGRELCKSLSGWSLNVFNLICLGMDSWFPKWQRSPVATGEAACCRVCRKFVCYDQGLQSVAICCLWALWCALERKGWQTTDIQKILKVHCSRKH